MALPLQGLKGQKVNPSWGLKEKNRYDMEEKGWIICISNRQSLQMGFTKKKWVRDTKGHKMSPQEKVINMTFLYKFNRILFKEIQRLLNWIDNPRSITNLCFSSPMALTEQFTWSSRNRIVTRNIWNKGQSQVTRGAWGRTGTSTTQVGEHRMHSYE